MFIVYIIYIQLSKAFLWHVNLNIFLFITFLALWKNRIFVQNLQNLVHPAGGGGGRRGVQGCFFSYKKIQFFLSATFLYFVDDRTHAVRSYNNMFTCILILFFCTLVTCINMCTHKLYFLF